MQTMMRRINRLPGIEPDVEYNKLGRLIIRSISDKYDRNYLESGHIVADETLVSIVRYMEQQENFDAYSQSKTLFISQNNNSYDRNKNKSSPRYTNKMELCK